MVISRRVEYTPPKRPPLYTLSSCVEYIKWVAGYSGSLGVAKNIKPNDVLKDSGFVLLNEGPNGHIAHYVRHGETLVLDETNFLSGQWTKGRQININDYRIRGYFTP